MTKQTDSKLFFSILDLHMTSHYLLIEEAVTVRNGSDFQTSDWSVCPEPVSLSVYKNYTFASPGHNIAHNHLSTSKKQLTKETHFVSETGLAN